MKIVSGALRALFGTKLSRQVASGMQPPTEAQVPAAEPSAFDKKIADLWMKTDYCARRLREMGMMPLEDSFIDQMVLGLLPNPDEPFIGSIRGRYLKLGDEPPRKIAFIGVVSGNGGAYFTAGFFDDDGKTLSTIGFVTVSELYEFLSAGKDDLAQTLADGKPGLLGRSGKYLTSDDKILPPPSPPVTPRLPNL